MPLAAALFWRESTGSGALYPSRGVLRFFDVQPTPAKAYGERRFASAKRLVLENAQKARGFVSLFAAYEVNTGRRRWALHVCCFMKQLHRWYPDQQVWVGSIAMCRIRASSSRPL